MNEKEKLLKSIAEIQNQIINYNRKDAINLIIKVRKEHLGKEQIAYVTNNIPLERGTDNDIINTLKAEETRLILKLQD